MIRTGLRVALLTLALTGCATHLDAVRQAPAGGPQSVPVAGAPYFLPFTQFEIVVTRRLEGCGEAGEAEPALQLAFQVQAVARQAPDPKRHYVLDFQALEGAFKKTGLTIDYGEGGVLQAVNAQSQDQVAQVVGAVAQSVARLAVAGLGGLSPFTADKSRPGSTNGICRPETARLVRGIQPQQQALAALTAKLTSAAAELEGWAAAGVQQGNKTDAQTQRGLVDGVKDVQRLRREQASLQAALEADLDKLTLVDKRIWPQDGETFQSDVPLVAGLSPAQLARWVTLPAPVSPTAPELLRREAESRARSLEAVQRQTAVWARLSTDASIGRSAPCGQACPDDAVKGLKYRVPVRGRLHLYRFNDAQDAAGVKEIHQQEGPISQLGPVFALPLHSTVFSEKTVAMQFDATGAPVRIALNATGGAGKAVEALGAATEQLAGIQEGRAARRLATVKDEIALTKAMRELEALHKSAQSAQAQNQEAIDAFTADTALMLAEEAKLKAAAALEAARKLAQTP